MPPGGKRQVVQDVTDDETSSDGGEQAACPRAGPPGWFNDDGPLPGAAPAAAPAQPHRPQVPRDGSGQRAAAREGSVRQPVADVSDDGDGSESDEDGSDPSYAEVCVHSGPG